MIKYAALLLLAAGLLTCSANNNDNVVVTTPLNTYTREDIISKAEAYIIRFGMFPQEVREDTEIWKQLIDDVIREFVYEDLRLINRDIINNSGEPELSEADIRERYEMLLLSQQQFFQQNSEIVSAAIKHPRDTIIYHPEGLKYVKFFTVPFEPEIRGRAAILLSENKMDEYERLVDDAARDMLPLIQELRQRLQNGFGFDELSQEFGGYTEDLLYDQDTGIFPAKLNALRTLTRPGDIARYNTYQGHVFMLLIREPEFTVIPYEQVRAELASSILENRIMIQHDRLLRELYDKAIIDGSVKIRNITDW